MTERRTRAALVGAILSLPLAARADPPDAGTPGAEAPRAPDAAPDAPPRSPPATPAPPLPAVSVSSIIQDNTQQNTLVEVQGEGVVTARRALDRVPGAATLVRREDLTQLAPQHAGDVLRTVPGVNVVGEDPMGLRLNISIRGLDPNRSRKVLVLEDGMPVSLNPYGSPELYYTPPIERMERVEVLRGSGQILYGPQTLGGVINYITREPPRRPTATADLRYGSYGYLLAQASAGATHGAVGWRLDVIHRRFDGPRHMDLALTDLAGRLRLQLSPRSVLGVKLDFYDESSASTYLGLSTPQYLLNPALNLASNDRFQVNRYALALTLQHSLSDAVVLRTNLYAYRTDRAWRRQEFDRQSTTADYERVCDPMGRCGAAGSPDIAPTPDGGSVYFRRTAAIRNRNFDVFGIEPRITWTWHRRSLSGEFIALARFHYERAHDQILVTSFPTGRSGDPRDEEARNGYAIASAVQHRFGFWERFYVTPGLRFEGFWSDRRVLRVPVTTPAGATVGSDVDTFGRTFSWAVIPGLGVSVNASRALTFFTGIHRGYAPPRTRDAIAPNGVNLQLDAELSWNSELGARVHLGRWLNAEIAGFHIEFENQIIPPSESGGAVATGGFNTGHSRHLGLESSVTFDLAALIGRRAAAFSLPLTVNYTWLAQAAFVGGLFDANRLPYAPEHLVYAQLRLVHRRGLSAQLGVSVVSAQFADKENTSFPSPDGLVGVIPNYLTADARVAYTVPTTEFTVYLSGRNLTDQIYIASRAPQGIQPAGFRQFFVGLEWAPRAPDAPR